MKKTVKKRKKSKFKFRIFFSLVVFCVIIASLGYNLCVNLFTINRLKSEKIVLNEKMEDLEKEKKELEVNILKLKDPDYIARYVREKYFYSKDGELILRIDE